MAKRMVTNFSRAAYPTYEKIDEDGQAKPCVYGVAWVNPDTIKTLRKRGGTRTDPKGQPLADDRMVPEVRSARA